MRKHHLTIAGAAIAALAIGFGCANKSSSAKGGCPSGTKAKGAAPPKGTLVYCVNKDGKKHGPWREYYDSKAIKSEGTYAGGKMTGTWTTYYDSVVNSEAETATAQEGKQPRKREQGRFTDGLRDGKWTKWYESGKKNTEKVYDLKSKKITWTAWRETGEKWATGFIVGLQNQGPYTEWHPSGKVAAKGEYDKGKKVGTWEYFDADGNPSTQPTGDFAN